MQSSPRRRTVRRSCSLAPFLAVAALTLVGCGSETGAAAGGELQVAAAFYPLQWVTEEVGGDRVEVTSLTKPGTEPHDLELTPRDVAAITDADLVVYLAGFQPAVDDAVDGAPASLDVTEAADLDLTLADGADHDHEGEEADDHEGDDGAVDPHFWLDPTRLGAVATAVADDLAERDPEHAADYRARAKALVARLGDLDAELESGLAECASTELVTSHQAFGYLARRYGFEQVGIAGLTPDQEPSAADLADVVTFVEDHDVRTIYFETLVSPAVAKTVAGEAGVETAVLDPIEGLTDASDGDDYVAVMRANLASLRAGQACT